MPTFGERFKELRLSKNYTQEQLAQEFNEQYQYTLGKSAISQYENNKRIPEINVLMDIAAYFDVSLDFLLCRNVNFNNYLEENISKYIVNDKKTFELTDLPKEFDRIIDEYSEITFDGKPASKKTIEFVKASIEIGIALAKKR